MYSDISIRIIACSSLKRNSANARASSVLPTPVVPIKINEPIGRLHPAILHGIDELRLPLLLLHPPDQQLVCEVHLPFLTSLVRSLSSIRLTGMPVHLATTSAMSSASTSSLSSFLFFCILLSSSLSVLIAFPAL
jgi:hypothetical protein